MGEAKRRAAYRPIDAAWRSLAERAIPPAAPDRQRIEMRRAFYAGAQSLFLALMCDLDPGAEPTEADEARVKAIDAELKAFAADLLAGRA